MAEQGFNHGDFVSGAREIREATEAKEQAVIVAARDVNDILLQLTSIGELNLTGSDIGVTAAVERLDALAKALAALDQ